MGNRWGRPPKTKYEQETDSEEVGWLKVWNCKGTLFIGPVLEHGPRSVGTRRVEGSSTGSEEIVKTCMCDPIDLWTMPGDCEGWRKLAGGGQSYWYATHWRELGVGAKDQTNSLVAGSFRNEYKFIGIRIVGWCRAPVIVNELRICLWIFNTLYKYLT